jgi:site-specific DNA-methyltransferase (adenine-specific)
VPAPGSTRHDLTSAQVEVRHLRPHPRNARNGDIETIAESLRVNGQYRPIVLAADGTILAGNHTYMAAVSLGWDTIAAVRIDVDPESPDALRIMLADNRTADLGNYDDGLLAQLLTDLDDATGLIGSGYTGDDLADLLTLINTPLDGQTDPDDVPSPHPTRHKTKTGQTWILGDHRLHVGDSRDPEAYRTLMDGDHADLLLTDPPYGVDYVGKTDEALTIDGDSTGVKELVTAALANAHAHLSNGAVFYVFSPPGPLVADFMAALDGAGLKMRQTLIWVKDLFVLGHSDYHYKHEPILYGWTEGGIHRYTGGRARDTILNHARPQRSKDHPTMKPVGLLEDMIGPSSRTTDIVLDPFGGSGSTLIACERLGRRARVIEIDPRYADVICRRYEEFRGILPVNAETGEVVSFTGEG